MVTLDRLTSGLSDNTELFEMSKEDGDMRSVLRHPQLDAAFKELVLTLPSETYIAEQLDVVDPQHIHAVREAMWWMWTQFSIRRKYTEKDVNQILNAHHTFGDQATLRRELVNMWATLRLSSPAWLAQP